MTAHSGKISDRPFYAATMAESDIDMICSTAGNAPPKTGAVPPERMMRSLNFSIPCEKEYT